MNFYSMTATNKQLLISKSRGDSNRWPPCRGKLDQYHDSRSHPQRRMDPTAPENQCSCTQPPARLSNSRVTVCFSSKPTSEALGERQHLLTICYLIYWTHKHQHAISTFNTYSRVPTPWSLTDTGEGYHTETSK
jgi:hypothetical protein